MEAPGADDRAQMESKEAKEDPTWPCTCMVNKGEEGWVREMMTIKQRDELVQTGIEECWAERPGELEPVSNNYYWSTACCHAKCVSAGGTAYLLPARAQYDPYELHGPVWEKAYNGDEKSLKTLTEHWCSYCQHGVPWTSTKSAKGKQACLQCLHRFFDEE